MAANRHSDNLFVLQPHPESSIIADGVELTITRTESSLHLKYNIKNADKVVLPPKALPQFTDNLWQHSCCELFIRSKGSSDYIEFNFSPSAEWAAYGFDDYRENMHPLSEFMPAISTKTDGSDFIIEVDIKGEFPEGEWDINATAILENIEGDKSYLALTHGKGEPDFHSPECFIGKVI